MLYFISVESWAMSSFQEHTSLMTASSVPNTVFNIYQVLNKFRAEEKWIKTFLFLFRAKLRAYEILHLCKRMSCVNWSLRGKADDGNAINDYHLFTWWSLPLHSVGACTCLPAQRETQTFPFVAEKSLFGGSWAPSIGFDENSETLLFFPSKMNFIHLIMTKIHFHQP